MKLSVLCIFLVISCALLPAGELNPKNLPDASVTDPNVKARQEFDLWRTTNDNESLTKMILSWKSLKKPIKNELLILLLEQVASQKDRHVTGTLSEGKRFTWDYHEGELAILAVEALLETQLPAREGSLTEPEATQFKLQCYQHAIRAMNIPDPNQSNHEFDSSALNEQDKVSLASMNDTPAFVLRELAKDESDAVRLAVARNQKTPLDVVRNMSKQDKNDEIRKAAMENRLHVRSIKDINLDQQNNLAQPKHGSEHTDSNNSSAPETGVAPEGGAAESGTSE